MTERFPGTNAKKLPHFPAGTQVVLSCDKTVIDTDVIRKAGSVGVVVFVPERHDGQYVIRFADEVEVYARADEVVARREEVDLEIGTVTDNLEQYIIYRCMVGSKAYGLAHENSDDDVRGIYLPPARLHWSLQKLPEQLETLDGKKDDVFWEIEKFIRLALKANPNVLETLWTPIVIEADETAEQLRTIRRAFLSKHLYKTYSGYVLSQFRRMSNYVKRGDAYKPKHAMHLIRLLYSGIGAMRRNEILVDVSEYRQELLRIRNDGLDFEEIRERALALDGEFQAAFQRTSLPEQPDYNTVNEFLISARRKACRD